MPRFGTFGHAYLTLLSELYRWPQYTCKPRGLEIRENLSETFTIDRPSSEPLRTGLEKRDKELASYLAKESKLFASKTNLASDFAEASKFWLKIANPDGTVNSNYGRLIWHDKSCKNEKFSRYEMTPWDWAKTKLMEDPDTRQAVLSFLRPDHLWSGNKDVTCTVFGHFFIRPVVLYDRTAPGLHFHVHMRSQDIWLGMPYDLPWFMGLMEQMVDELKSFVPGLVIGHYTHTADSLHLYSRDYDKAAEVLEANGYKCHKFEHCY